MKLKITFLTLALLVMGQEYGMKPDRDNRCPLDLTSSDSGEDSDVEGLNKISNATDSGLQNSYFEKPIALLESIMNGTLNVNQNPHQCSSPQHSIDRSM